MALGVACRMRLQGAPLNPGASHSHRALRTVCQAASTPNQVRLSVLLSLVHAVIEFSLNAIGYSIAVWPSLQELPLQCLGLQAACSPRALGQGVQVPSGSDTVTP